MNALSFVLHFIASGEEQAGDAGDFNYKQRRKIDFKTFTTASFLCREACGVWLPHRTVWGHCFRGACLVLLWVWSRSQRPVLCGPQLCGCWPAPTGWGSDPSPAEWWGSTVIDRPGPCKHLKIKNESGPGDGSKRVRAWRGEEGRIWRGEGVRERICEGLEGWGSEGLEDWRGEGVKGWRSDGVREWKNGVFWGDTSIG